MTCKPVGNGLVGDSYRFDLTYDDLIWSQGNQLRSFARRALKRSMHFLEQKGVRHE
jgi:hypothetical protein